MNTRREHLREALLGGVFLVIGLLQIILFVIRAEPHTVNLVLGTVFLAGGFYFSVSFLHRKSG